MMTGVFASNAINSAGKGWLIDGNGHQMLIQFYDVAAVFVYCGIGHLHHPEGDRHDRRPARLARKSKSKVSTSTSTAKPCTADPAAHGSFFLLATGAPRKGAPSFSGRLLCGLMLAPERREPGVERVLDLRRDSRYRRAPRRARAPQQGRVRQVRHRCVNSARGHASSMRRP